MGLITQEVEIKLGNNIKYYESLGYIIPKFKDEHGRLRVLNDTKIIVKTLDLKKGCHILVEVQCKGCDKILKAVFWKDYVKVIEKHGEYYCVHCAQNIFGGEKSMKTRLAKSISFDQWCINHDRQDILDRFDYKLNNYMPSEITFGTSKKGYFKCERGLHPSELKSIGDFTGGHNGVMECRKCHSFEQWCIDNVPDFFEKYWDYDKNIINPLEIGAQSKQYVWLKCQEKDYHGSYLIQCFCFVRGGRCSFCGNHKVHPLDSLGKILEEHNLLNLWSDKNKKSSYEYTPNSHQKVWWKCPDGKHKEYFRSIGDTNTICNFRCPECTQERKESILQEKVRLYLLTFDYTILHEHNCTIVPKNPKTKRPLPFDNEIKELKLIIEVHGIQHYKITSWHKSLAKKNDTTPEYELHMQQVRDRYKRFISYKQGYKYIAIPYTSNNKKEEYKQLINNKINEIT